MVSPIYKKILPSNEEIVSGIIFSEEVIILSDVRKALKKINFDSDIKRIAIGYNFTIEALKLLKDNNFDVFFISNFAWSDERYKEVKSGNS